MPRAVRARELRIELAVRGAQPSLPDGRMWIERALEHDLPALRVEHAQHDENVGVASRRGDEKLERRRAGDLRLASQRRRREGDALAHGVVRNSLFGRNRFFYQTESRGIEVEPRPLRAGKRPFV